jgi:hypothetical protein
MKTWGIILIVFGSLSAIGACMATAEGHNASFAGLGFIALGAYLVSRANKKKDEEEQKRRWEQSE